jgi:hypothetical protein
VRVPADCCFIAGLAAAAGLVFDLPFPAEFFAAGFGTLAALTSREPDCFAANFRAAAPGAADFPVLPLTALSAF